MFLPLIFENRCGDFRRSMWRLSKIDVSPFEDRCHDVSTFEDRCVDLRRSVIYVSIFEDQWSMCRPSKIDGRCEIRLLYLLKTLVLYISCMRITPRVCTSVLSLYLYCVYVCVCVCPLISAASHIRITQQRYQRVHSNTAIVFNFADFPKNAYSKVMA